VCFKEATYTLTAPNGKTQTKKIKTISSWEISASSAGGTAKLYRVPEVGTLTFRFDVDRCGRTLKVESNTEMLRAMQWRKRRVNLQQFAVIAASLEDAPNQDAKRQVVIAISHEVSISSKQFFYLLDKDPLMRKDVVLYLTSAMHDMKRWKMLEVIRPKRTMMQECMEFRREIGSRLFLEPENPTGRYCLHLRSPTEYHVALSMLQIHAWEKARREESGLMDFSQYGTGDYLRNVEMNAQSYKFQNGLFTRDSGFSVAMPHEGADIILQFDYASPFYVQSKKTEFVGDDMWTQIDRTMKECEALEYDIVRVFRCMLSRCNLKVTQVRDMLRWFPQPYFRPALCSADRRVQDAGNYDDPRLEAFVAAFSLSSERSLLVDLMTDRTVFTVSERRQLQKRLGWIPTCDAPKIGAPEFWYSELPTFDCSVHEQRYLCSMILRVVYNEGKKTPESAYYTAASSTSLEVDFFPIPVTWGSGGIPKDEVGTLSFNLKEMYNGVARLDVDPVMRKQVCKEWLGWDADPSLYSKKGPDTIWRRLDPSVVSIEIMNQLMGPPLGARPKLGTTWGMKMRGMRPSAFAETPATRRNKPGTRSSQ
jgi:hypothetical protein